METSTPYQVSREIYLRTWMRRWFFRPKSVILSLLLLCISVFLLLFGGEEYFLFAMALLGLDIGMPLGIHRSLGKTLDDNPVWTDRKTLSFDEHHLISEGSNWKMELPWENILGFSENDNYLFLHANRQGLGTIIPKTALTLEQINQIRTYATRATAKAAKNL